jgi:hypothetical protein
MKLMKKKKEKEGDSRSWISLSVKKDSNRKKRIINYQKKMIGSCYPIVIREEG